MRRPLALGLALMASACVLHPDKAEYKGRMAPGEGLVVFSVAQPAIDTWDRLKTKIVFGPAGERTDTFWRATNPFHWGEVASVGRGNPSAFSGVNGQVFAIAVPAGSYEVVNFAFTQQPKSGAGGVVYSFKKDHPLPFQVRAREVVYIGAFELKLERKHNFLGIVYYQPAAFEITEQGYRDMAELRRRFPEIGAVTPAIVDGGSWKVFDEAALGQPGDK